MLNIIKLDETNIDNEHICCAISDKKCAESYEAKKQWLRERFAEGYVFRRIDARAKVFLEYCPAEVGWVPVIAPNYLLLNCFWVSGQYKGQGYAKELLRLAIEDSRGKDGLTTVAGKKKLSFMSDAKWLIKQGFEVCDESPAGFVVLTKKLNSAAPDPKFTEAARACECPNKNGIVVYYSNRCPFSEFHVKNTLSETLSKRDIPLEIIKLSSREMAQNAPTPATIFSMFYNGKYITNDISVCMDSRFDKAMSKFIEK